MTDATITGYQEAYTGLRADMAAGFPADSLKLWDGDAARMGSEYTQPLKLNIGDAAPLFSLPNATGKTIALADALKAGPVVLTFYRGVWCPYCNLALRLYQAILPEMKALGAQLFALSPQTPDNSLSTTEKNGLAFEVLSDSYNNVAKQYVHVFINSDASTAEALKLGVDFSAFNDGDIVELPVPAVYIIGQDGKVAFAATEGADYRHRVEPQAILDALQALA